MTSADIATHSRDVSRQLVDRFVQYAEGLHDRDERLRLGRRLLYVLVALMPLHAGLVALHVPSAWKELLIGVILVIALTLPSPARFERADWLVVLYFGIVALSALSNRVSNLSDIAPYLVYVPFAVIVPRLEIRGERLKTLLWIATGSLLINFVWMIGLHAGPLRFLNLSAEDGYRWATTGSLTGGGLATASLYGVASGTAWIGAALSRHKISLGLLGLIFTIAANMTGSRAGLLLSAAGLFIGLVLLTVRYRSVRRVGRWLMVGCVVAAVVAAIATPRVLRSDDPLRVGRWQAAIHLALEHPVLGAGPGAISQGRAIRELGLAANGPLPDNVIGTRVSESSALKVAAEVGFPALIAIAVWLFTVLLRGGAFRVGLLFENPLAAVGPALLLLTVINGLTYQNMESFIGAGLFWLGIGLCRNAAAPSSAVARR